MILLHPPRAYPDGETKSHAASDGSLHELFLFAETLGLDPADFRDHEHLPHYRVPPRLFEHALAVTAVRVREAARKELASSALTRSQIRKTRVVNLEHGVPFDVRVDRASRWGNSFRIGEHGTRPEVVELFRQQASQDPDLLDSLKHLKGKTLACNCKPKACHADVYVDLIRGAPIPQGSLF